MKLSVALILTAAAAAIAPVVAPPPHPGGNSIPNFVNGTQTFLDRAHNPLEVSEYVTDTEQHYYYKHQQIRENTVMGTDEL
jgi:hypothetical protein